VLCFQIEVPNESAYINAFYGAIWALTYSKNWARDRAHTAAEVSRVWSKIFFDLHPGGCQPPVPPFGHGIEQEELMPLRIDCDCNVFITCCDGTEKQLLTADQVRALLSQGGSGTPQPKPGGGCQKYSITVPAGAIGALIPTIVSTGDTIELSNLAGAWYGGSVTWYCPDGSVFFVDCSAATNLSGGSQIPGSPIGRVIALINGTYYDILASTFTVPGGITNAQVTLLMNTDTVSTASGSVTLDATVCNNQTARWSHFFNFTVETGPFVSNAPLEGVWSPGTGFTSQFDGGSTDEVFVKATMPAGSYDKATWTYTATDTGTGYIGTPTIFDTLSVAPGDPPHVWNGPLVAGNELDLEILKTGTGSGGHFILTGLLLEGPGSDPF
jgi:hypothetical protein